MSSYLIELRPLPDCPTLIQQSIGDKATAKCSAAESLNSTLDSTSVSVDFCSTASVLPWSPGSIPAAGLGVGYEPLQRDVNIVLLFARDGVTTDLPVLDGVQVHFLDEAVLVEGTWQVPLVAQYQDRDPRQLYC